MRLMSSAAVEKSSVRIVLNVFKEMANHVLCAREPKFTSLLHKGRAREVHSLVIYCPQKNQGCEWKGEVGQLEHHLNKEGVASTNKGCDYVMVACKYECGTHLPRKLIWEHEREECKRLPIEDQLANLSQKVKAVFVQNQVLQKELDTVKQAYHQQQREMEKIKQLNLQQH